MAYHVLVVDDEESIRYTFAVFLKDAGYQVTTVQSLAAALPLVQSGGFDAVFLDILLGRESGMQILKESRQADPFCPVVMVTGAPEITTAAEAVRLGAFDYITKPVHQDELLRLAARATEHKALLLQQEQYKQWLTAVFESVSEGLLVFDEDYILVNINDAACRMLGCNEKVVGQRLPTLVEDAGCRFLGAFRDLLEARFEGELYRVDLTNAAGKPMMLSVSMSALTSASGRANGVVMVLRDEALPTRQIEV